MTVRLTAVRDDITRQQVDVVVNAANPGLLGGGGVDGAIHRAGGPAILAECRERKAELPDGRLPRGQAVATTAGELPARWVVHTAGPVYSPGEDRSAILASCYVESLRVAESLGATSVAFPAISAGIYGWPLDDAARIAVEAVRRAAVELPLRSVAEVRFVLFNGAGYDAFVAALGGPSAEVSTEVT